jgi:mannose-1-phosphate guanylyltransferase
MPRYAVIMAGGQSTRFWPLSRKRRPKQLLSIMGRHTLLQETARRLLPLVPWRRMLVVTAAEYAREVSRQLPRVPREHVLAEPMGRNTAPCIALAAEWMAARCGDALMVVVPADHVIKNASGLQRAWASACTLAARHDCLVTLGIQPTRPETGYGYIELARPVDPRSPDAFWVRRFHEKPVAAVAKRYAASGRHLWNSGMFVWKVNVFRDALARCLPDVQRALEGLWGSHRHGAQDRLRRIYRSLPSVSVDAGVLQPMSRNSGAVPQIAVIRAGFDWIDAGSWAAMADLLGQDDAGNTTVGKVLTIDARDSIVYCPQRLVALVGVKQLIVVENDGALLVCARERAQDVRQVTGELRRRGWSRYV